MFHLSDDAILAIYERLSTDLNGFIDQVNTTLTNPEYPIEYPAKIYDYIPPVAELTEFPSVCIGDGPIHFADDVGWSATGDFDFAVVVWIHEYDSRALTWKLRRYMTAVANCVLELRSLGGGGWGMILGSIEPGPTLGRLENPREIISMRAMTFSVRDEQDS